MCWSFKLLASLEALGLLQPQEWRRTHHASAEQVQQLRFAGDGEADIRLALARVQADRYRRGLDPGANPRDNAVSEGIERCTHSAWVYMPDPTATILDRSNAPPHMKLSLPFTVLQCLARFRLGWHHLQVHVGRFTRGSRRQPRSIRLCPFCSCPNSPTTLSQAVTARTGTADNVEDLLHFMVECPAYDRIRAAYPDLFFPTGGTNPFSAACLRHVFSLPNQALVASAIYQMNLFRARELPHLLAGSPSNPYSPPVGILPADAAYRLTTAVAQYCPDERHTVDVD